MKIPKIIKSNKILDNLSWFMRIGGITLWPFIIVRPYVNRFTINHEKIHIKQQQELLVIFFYILYVLEWVFGLIKYRDSKKSYYNISFEREAYQNEQNLQYINDRKLFNWIKYVYTKNNIE